MSPSLDYIVDRRRLRRKLTFWRILGLVFLGGLLLSLFSYSSDDDEFVGAHIARIDIGGLITNDRNLRSLLREVRSDDSVTGVILVVDSPGGTLIGGESLYFAVRNLATTKPVVTSVGGLATSAGYMVAVAADYIVAHNTSIVGSIGVVAYQPRFHDFLENLGISIDEIKSSPLKAEPSPFSDSPLGEAAMRSTITDVHSWFTDLVASRRPLTRLEAVSLSDGSIYTGRLALDRKLVDAIGGIDVARSWLVNERGVPSDIPIVDRVIDYDFGFFSLGLVDWTKLHLRNFFISFLGDVLYLDGLSSIWHG